jgi:hypothetical protein
MSLGFNCLALYHSTVANRSEQIGFLTPGGSTMFAVDFDNALHVVYPSSLKRGMHMKLKNTVILIALAISSAIAGCAETESTPADAGQWETVSPEEADTQRATFALG